MEDTRKKVIECFNSLGFVVDDDDTVDILDYLDNIYLFVLVFYFSILFYILILLRVHLTDLMLVVLLFYDFDTFSLCPSLLLLLCHFLLLFYF